MASALKQPHLVRQSTLSTRFVDRTRGILATAVCGATLSTLVVAPAHAEPVNPDDSQIQNAITSSEQSAQDVGRIAASMSEKQSEISRIENEMGGLRQAVNKAMVDYVEAQREAERARKDVDTARGGLDEVQRSLEDAQKLLDELSRATYRNGATPSAVSGAAGKESAEDALTRQTYLRLNASKQREAITNLDVARTEQANKEAELREAKNAAEGREKDASAKEQQAKAAIDETAQRLNAKVAERNTLVQEQNNAQARLDQARGNVAELKQQRAEYLEYKRAKEERERKEAEARAAAEAKAKAEAEARAKAQAEAEAKAKAEAAAEAEREAARQRAAEAAQQAAAAKAKAEAEAKAEAAAQEAQASANSAAETAASAVVAVGGNGATGTGSVQDQADQIVAADPAGATGTTTGTTTATTPSTSNPTAAANQKLSDYFNSEDFITLDSTSTVEVDNTVATGTRAEKIEAVIGRAEKYLGTPYAWGGGTATGPSKGIRDGGVADSYGDYNKVGFDCSGLVLFAFAGVGISLPHYTGYQYQRGTKVDIANIQRGDLLFWGPNAEHHVAIYLGNGMMLEAPQSGGVVQKSPVRYDGISPYAVRLI